MAIAIKPNLSVEVGTSDKLDMITRIILLVVVLMATTVSKAQDALPILWQKLAMDSCTAIDVSPDGDEIAISSDNGAICFFDSRSGIFRRWLPAPSYVQHIKYSPKGTFLALAFWQAYLGLYDAHTGELLWRVYSPGPKSQPISFSQDSSLLGGGSVGSATVWRSADGSVAWSRHDSKIQAAVLAPDGRRMVIVRSGVPHCVQIWDISLNVLLAEFGGLAQNTASISISNDGQLLSLGLQNHGTEIWQIGNQTLLFRSPNSNRINCSFSPDNNRLAENTYPFLKVWDWQANRIIATTPGDGSTVRFTPDGNSLIYSHNSGKRFDFMTNQVTSYEGDIGSSLAFEFSRSGNVLAVCDTHTGDTFLMDTVTGQEISRLSHGWPLSPIVASPTQDIFVMRGVSVHEFNIRDSNTGNVILSRNVSLGNEWESLRDVAFSPDGEMAILMGWKSLEIWDTSDWHWVENINLSRTPEKFAVDQTGRFLAVSCDEGWLGVYDLASHQLVFEYRSFWYPDIQLVGFARGGSLLAISKNVEEEMRFFRTKDWQLNHVIPFAYSSDQRLKLVPGTDLIATESSNNDFRFVDMQTGRIVATYAGYGQGNRHLAMSVDGSRFAFVSGPVMGMFRNPMFKVAVRH
ncbi:MAG: PD40 domain-containing protein [Chthonomonadaceae bacterium]|nr:PD40 domain-containing protein [Chthonomonadaceae bacterium]